MAVDDGVGQLCLFVYVRACSALHTFISSVGNHVDKLRRFGVEAQPLKCHPRVLLWGEVGLWTACPGSSRTASTRSTLAFRVRRRALVKANACRSDFRGPHRGARARAAVARGSRCAGGALGPGQRLRAALARLLLELTKQPRCHERARSDLRSPGSSSDPQLSAAGRTRVHVCDPEGDAPPRLPVIDGRSAEGADSEGPNRLQTGAVGRDLLREAQARGDASGGHGAQRPPAWQHHRAGRLRGSVGAHDDLPGHLRAREPLQLQQNIGTALR